MVKAVILIGGPLKGTRFRPLSLDIPKPLFPIAGLPMIQHHIEACAAVPNLREVLILGYYHADTLAPFISDMMQEYKIMIRYLQEFSPLGTAGGLFHFRDQIRSGNPEAFFVINGDVCADFPLQEMLEMHQKQKKALATLMVTEATRQQSMYYGCVVRDKDTGEVTHYVEKPETFVSTLINCGVYVFSIEIFQEIGRVFDKKQADYLRMNGMLVISFGKMKSPDLTDISPAFVNQSWTAKALRYLVNAPGYGPNRLFHEDLGIATVREEMRRFTRRDLNNGSGKHPSVINLEMEILLPLAGTGKLFAYQTKNWWSQLKTAGGAIYANRHYLALYRENSPGRLAKTSDGKCKIIGDVHIHPTASVDSSAVLGPNVSVGRDAVIGPGVRMRESIILSGASIGDHSLVLHSIIGCQSQVGSWTRVEGTPCDPNPNKPFAKMDNPPLFNSDGRLNPSITILGCSVYVTSEVILLNSIVLPNKALSRSFKNEIIL